MVVLQAGYKANMVRLQIFPIVYNPHLLILCLYDKLPLL